jgi:hypothetical protein
MAEGPLGDEGNAQWPTLPPLSRSYYITIGLLLLQLLPLLLLQLLLRTTEENEMNRTESYTIEPDLRSSLIINVCPFSYKGTSIYRRPPGVIKQLNYTFSVPDKRLYTLSKGVTVTPALYGHPACLRTVDPPLHAAPFVSPS